jgi:hypothetical protein
MSIVLDETTRDRAFTAVGSSDGIADNLWNEWRPGTQAEVGRPIDPVVTTWVEEYLKGVRVSVSEILDRDLKIVSGAEALAGFWAQHRIDQQRPSALANLARIVFNIAHEVRIGKESYPIHVVELEASRLRFPNLKASREARADRTLSNRGGIDAQLASAATQLPPGCQLVVVDDRLQSGGTLTAVHHAALSCKLSPHAIIVAHSELPRSDAQGLLPNVALYAHVYDYLTNQEKEEWLRRHKSGDVRLPVSEELHDIISVSPASGEAIVNQYMDAFPRIKVVYSHLKEAFKKLAGGGVRSVTDILRDAGDVVKIEELNTLGVDIRDQDAFLLYVANRAAEHALARSEFQSADQVSGEESKRRQSRELKTRWGANDIDHLFSHTSGSLALRDHPEFNTDTADKRRFGAFFPFPHRSTLTVSKELKSLGDMAWARYSYDELTRSVQLVDKWQQRFGNLSPLSIPHLSAPAVQRFMNKKQVNTNALDQLNCLRRVLEEQIEAKVIRPLI